MVIVTIAQYIDWGIGGTDANTEPEERDSTKWEYEWDRFYADMNGDAGALGLRHNVVVGTQGHLETHLTVTGSRAQWEMRRLDGALTLQDNFAVESADYRGIFGAELDYRLGRRLMTQSGFNIHRMMYDHEFMIAPDDEPPLQSISVGDGASTLFQGYTQSKLRLTRSLTLNGGVHAQYFALTNKYAVEPRGALRWELGNAQALSLGYGKHSQLEELRIYLARPIGSAVARPNQDLDFTKAHHLVLGYDRRIGDASRLKLETYYQYLYDVPVIADSSFSMINFRQDWEFSEALVNDGAGRNYGVELTLERFLKNGYYFLFTGSLFESRYRGGDDVWRDTRWNRGRSVTALAGKEFTIGGDDLIGVSSRLEYTGGLLHSPVDPVASSLQGTVVFDESRAYTERAPQTYVVDFTVTYRRNHSHVSEVWALQVKNALMSPNFFHEYNYVIDAVEEVRQGMVLPVLSYKLEF